MFEHFLQANEKPCIALIESFVFLWIGLRTSIKSILGKSTVNICTQRAFLEWKPLICFLCMSTLGAKKCVHSLADFVFKRWQIAVLCPCSHLNLFFTIAYRNWHLIWANNHISCRCIALLVFVPKTSEEIGHTLSERSAHRPRLLRNMPFWFAHRFAVNWLIFLIKLCLVLDFGLMNTA